MKILSVIATALCLSACGRNYSNGSRVGTVQKLSERGLIFKSWEGEMMMGGMKQKANYNSKGEYSGSSSVANVFEFNVDSPCIEQVKQAQQSGRRVELVYRQWFLRPWNISNSHVVIAVNEADRGSEVGASWPATLQASGPTRSATAQGCNGIELSDGAAR